MALPKIDQVRKLSDDDLGDRILAVKKQLFDLRLQKATRQTVQAHQVIHAKHELSQLLTVEGERFRAAIIAEAEAAADAEADAEAQSEPADDSTAVTA